MRKTKRKLLFWEPYEKETLARLLEEEAARGWHLSRISGFWMVFQRGAPKQVRYSPILDSNADGYDFQPGEETREYIDYCAAAGWEYVCGQGSWRFFRTEDRDAPPIETDPELELEAIHSLWRKMRIVLGAEIVLLCLYGVLAVQSWNWATWFINYSTWGVWLTLLGCLVVGLDYLISYLRWHGAQKKRVELGYGIDYPPSRWRYRMRKALLLRFVVLCWGGSAVLDIHNGNWAGYQMAAVLVLVVVWCFASQGVFRLLENTRPETSRVWGRILLIGLYVLCFAGGRFFGSDFVQNRLFHRAEPVEGGWFDELDRDDLPLTLADLGVEFDAAWEDRERVQTGRAAVAYLFAIDQVKDGTGEPALVYYVHHTKWTLIHEKYLEEYAGMQERGEEVSLVPDWRVWKEPDGYGLTHWLLVNGETVIYLHTDLELDETQLSTVAQRLESWGEGTL